MPRLTDGWKRRPPLYGPSALLNSTRKPRLTWTCPRRPSTGTRKMICRSGSHDPLDQACLARTRGAWRAPGRGSRSTSCTAWWNSGWPGLRCSISVRRQRACPSENSWLAGLQVSLLVGRTRGRPCAAGGHRPQCLPSTIVPVRPRAQPSGDRDGRRADGPRAAEWWAGMTEGFPDHFAQILCPVSSDNGPAGPTYPGRQPTGKCREAGRPHHDRLGDPLVDERKLGVAPKGKPERLATYPGVYVLPRGEHGTVVAMAESNRGRGAAPRRAAPRRAAPRAPARPPARPPAPPPPPPPPPRWAEPQVSPADGVGAVHLAGVLGASLGSARAFTSPNSAGREWASV